MKSFWLIYDERQYCLQYIARRYEIDRAKRQVYATEDEIMSPNLDAVRQALRSHGLICVERPGDQPKIVESWI
jgi:hypothetical protein